MNINPVTLDIGNAELADFAAIYHGSAAMTPVSQASSVTPFDVAKANRIQGETVNVSADLANPTKRPVLTTLVVQITQSAEHSLEKYIADKFAAIDCTLAVYRERIGETLKFYTIVRDDDEGDASLDNLFDQERAVYKTFPEDDLDFEVLLGSELVGAVPTGAILIWQRD